MNKQELIEKYEKLEGVCKDPGAEIARLIFLEDLRELDEPQKPVVPQFVADFIEYAKRSDWDLEVTFQDIAGNDESSDIYQWYYCDSNNMVTFARAWLDGYEIAKEKKYSVRIKNIQSGTSFLKYDLTINKFYFGIYQDSDVTRLYYTREELEKAGFSWVFSCEGVEIEEVEG